MLNWRKFTRCGMWVILVGLLAAWLAATIRNPHRAEAVHSVAFSPDGKMLALGTNDSSVVLFDVTIRKRLAELRQDEFAHWIKFVQFSADGRTLFGGGDSADLVVWDVATTRRLSSRETQFGNRTNCGAVSPDGKLIAFGSEDDTIRIWNWSENSPPREIITTHKQRLNSIAFSPDGTLLATGSADETIKLTDVESGAERATLFWDDQSQVNTSVSAIAFSPDGKSLLAGMEHGTVVIWDVETHAQRVVLHPHSDNVAAVAYSIDGTRFATAGWDGQALVFDALTYTLVHNFAADSRWVWAVSFSTDGRTLVTGGDEGTAKLWDLKSGVSTRFVAEPETAHWWLMGLAVWCMAYLWVRSKTVVVQPAIAYVSTEATPTGLGETAPIFGADELAASIVLGVGGILYALLCGPAIGQRGFPPIDPAWTGVTFLWVAPILLAGILDGRPIRRRLKGLSIYSFATAFIDAASIVIMVPKFVDPLSTLLMTIFCFGPVHWVIGLVLAMLVLGIRLFVSRVIKNWPSNAVAIVRHSAAGVMIALTIAFPFLFREYMFFDMRNRGRIEAESAWNDRQAVRYIADHVKAGDISHEFDLTAGLKFRHMWPESDFTRAYNERISAFLLEQGIPAWSMKQYLVDDSLLVSLLDSDDFEDIETFPYEINDNIILFRRGTMTRWGSTMSNGSDSLSIATPHSLRSLGDKLELASVWRSARHPQVIFIRHGRNWVGAYHESGELLSAASRY